MKKILVTWHYAGRGEDDLIGMLNSLERRGEKINEILYLNRPKEAPVRFQGINGVKYEALMPTLLDDADIAKLCGRHFKNENTHIIDISVNNAIDVHIPAFASFFMMDEKRKNVKFVKYEDHNISSLAIDDACEYLASRVPAYSLAANLLVLSLAIKILTGLDNKEKQRIKVCIQTKHPILLLGERGTGKSQYAEDIRNEMEKRSRPKKNRNFPFVIANCASFADDMKAEAELFGYKKGAFTGAGEDYDGLFKEANNGILFLDEIHRLSKSVQAKLMRALQPDRDNKMRIRPMKSTREESVEFKLITATNKTINELREILEPDFYDRIVQHVIEISPLRDKSWKIEEIWQNVWKQRGYDGPAPAEKPLIDWLKEQKFWGNYRDLQRIALYYHEYTLFDGENRPAQSALDYVKGEFTKYGLANPAQNTEAPFFERGKTAKEMELKYHFELQKWAVERYGDRKKAADALDVDPRTLRDWKNMKHSAPNALARGHERR